MEQARRVTGVAQRLRGQFEGPSDVAEEVAQGRGVHEVAVEREGHLACAQSRDVFLFGKPVRIHARAVARPPHEAQDLLPDGGDGEPGIVEADLAGELEISLNVLEQGAELVPGLRAHEREVHREKSRVDEVSGLMARAVSLLQESDALAHVARPVDGVHAHDHRHLAAGRDVVITPVEREREFAEGEGPREVAADEVDHAEHAVAERRVGRVAVLDRAIEQVQGEKAVEVEVHVEGGGGAVGHDLHARQKLGVAHLGERGDLVEGEALQELHGLREFGRDGRSDVLARAVHAEHHHRVARELDRLAVLAAVGAQDDEHVVDPGPVQRAAREGEDDGEDRGRLVETAGDVLALPAVEIQVEGELVLLGEGRVGQHVGALGEVPARRFEGGRVLGLHPGVEVHAGQGEALPVALEERSRDVQVVCDVEDLFHERIAGVRLRYREMADAVV